MATILVTGGSGFIGRHVVEVLLVRGDRVRVLDVAEPEYCDSRVEFMRGSVADPAAAENAVAAVERVYHLAGIPHLWCADRRHFDSVNRRGTEVMLRAAAESRVRRFVHCSTESILLPKRANGHAVDESAWPDFEDMPGPYTRSKYLAERAALDAARNGMDVVVVNPTVPIGPGDRNMTPPAAMLSLFLSGGSPFFLDCILNLVDVRDVAAGIVLAGDSGRSGERYVLGGENVALRDLLPRLQLLSGKRMPNRAVPAPLAMVTGMLAGWVADRITHRPPVATHEGVTLALRSAPFDSGKAKRELGYAPRPVDGALTEAVDAFKRGAGGGRPGKSQEIAKE
jgi:dihydroflavonol-4-reductase